MGSDRGDQPALFASDIRDMLPADHNVWAVMATVADFDLSVFEGAYRADGQGRPPYSPRMMVELLLYCYQKGICSDRAIAAACYDDLGCRVITGNRFPTRSTVNEFFHRHADALQELLVQTIRLGAQEGLVDVSVIAGDGTMVKANASTGALAGEEALTRRIARLQARLDHSQAGWQQAVLTGLTEITDTTGDPQPGEAGPADQAEAEPADQAEAGPADQAEAEAGAGRGGADREVDQEVVARRRVQADARLLAGRQAALARLREQPSRAWQEWSEREQVLRTRMEQAEARLARLRAEQQDRLDRWRQAEAGGRPWRGKPPTPAEDKTKVARARQSVAQWASRLAEVTAIRPDRGRVNVTDPDSALMPGKHGGFALYYNVQAITARRQFVLDVGLHPSSNDKQALVPALRRTRQNLDAAGISDPIGAGLFDSGYASDANFTDDVPVTTLLVSVDKERRQTGRDTITTGSVHEKWDTMAVLLDDPKNAALYKQRSAMVEPVFAQFFARFGRELAHRGIPAVTTEIHLWAAAHNLAKIIASRARRAAAA
jgi:transposase